MNLWHKMRINPFSLSTAPMKSHYIIETLHTTVVSSSILELFQCSPIIVYRLLVAYIRLSTTRLHPTCELGRWTSSLRLHLLLQMPTSSQPRCATGTVPSWLRPARHHVRMVGTDSCHLRHQQWWLQATHPAVWGAGSEDGWWSWWYYPSAVVQVLPNRHQ